jgi:hypothetical protein
MDAQLNDFLTERLHAIALPNLPSNLGTSPLIKDLKVKKRTFYPDRVEVVLTWTEPLTIANDIAHYTITVEGSLGDTTTPVGHYTCRNSPAKISVPITPGIQALVFRLQTVLANGFVSLPELACTTALQIRPGSQNLPTMKKFDGSSYITDTVFDTIKIPANTILPGTLIEYELFGEFSLESSANPKSVTLALKNEGDPFYAIICSSVIEQSGLGGGAVSPGSFWFKVSLNFYDNTNYQINPHININFTRTTNPIITGYSTTNSGSYTVSQNIGFDIYCMCTPNNSTTSLLPQVRNIKTFRNARF